MPRLSGCWSRWPPDPLPFTPFGAQSDPPFPRDLPGSSRASLSRRALRAGAVILVAGAGLLGSHDCAEAQTPALSLSLSAATIAEGGPSIVATVTAAGGTFPSDRTIELEWDGAPLADGLIQGPDNTGAVTLAAAETGVSVALSAPDDATGLVYVPDRTASLTATDSGTEIGSAPLRYLDNDGRAAVTIAAASGRVVEGGDIVLVATLAQPAGEAHSVELTVTDPYGALTGTVPAGFGFGANETEAAVTLRSADNGAEDGAREIVFALAATAGTALAAPGTPSSVAVWVDDDDAPPGAPRNVAATPGPGSVTLAWDEPEYSSGGRIDKYQYRRSDNGGLTWYPGWFDVGGGAGAGQVVAQELTAGTEYIFEMRAVSKAAGRGRVSARVTATPLAPPPEPASGARGQ